MVTEKSICELQREVDNGNLTYRQITLEYLKRIAKYDLGKEGLHSVIEINPDAISIAETMDRERLIKGKRSPMHGMPVLLKDNISTMDKTHTTAGSMSLDDNIAMEDAALVKMLRKAGAVILGKTNMTEFAAWISTTQKDGYSSRGGQVVNPYGRELEVQGSSSGSCVSAAASFCAASVGTETWGSIVAPSSHNGVYGLKPTCGLVSTDGIIPICSQDVAGPIGRTVEDVAILLSAIVTEPYDYTEDLDKLNLKGLRLGVNRVRMAKEFFPEDSIEIFERKLDKLRAAGVNLVDLQLSYTGRNDEKAIHGLEPLYSEFRTALDFYLTRYASSKCRSLADIVAYNKDHPEPLLYGQDILETCLETYSRVNDKAYIEMKIEAYEKGQKEIDDAINEYGLDGIICDNITCVPAVIGYPAITVPIGMSDTGLPVALCIYSKAFEEKKLLQIAYAMEKYDNTRIPPKL